MHRRRASTALPADVSGEGAVFEVDPQVYGSPCARTFHYSYVGPGAPAHLR
ncbi:MAG TPA: hypothetical protein VM324_06510 [Egibacteraceae bacterium]|nr:hypothetical protein [Egibacteraceae bacterium]